MIQKIISGAQTGADRGGLDAAIEAGVEYGGWLPKGRKAEDGEVASKYSKLSEMKTGGYPKRTEQNVNDSDGTVIFTYGKLSSGSALTKKCAKKLNKPCLHVDLDAVKEPLPLIINFLKQNNIEILNVAGRSESKAPGIYEEVKSIIISVLKNESLNS